MYNKMYVETGVSTEVLIRLDFATHDDLIFIWKVQEEVNILNHDLRSR